MNLPDNYINPAKWQRWGDGYVTCWWCTCLVHPQTVEIHDAWHRRLEGDEPVGTRPDPFETEA